MSMTWDEVAELLAYCAAYDNRQGDDLDIQAWLDVATDNNWDALAAVRVTREHYGRDGDRPRLNPATITDRIRAVRKKAAETFEYPRIPEHVADADYPAWLRAQRDRHVDALVNAWAVDGVEPPVQLPPAPTPNQLGQRRIAELTAGAFQAIPSAADTAGKPPTVDGMQARSAALAVHCAYCSARPGEPCTRSSAGGRVRISNPHPARSGRSVSEEAS
jgi:hypothetical protein